MRNIFYCIFTSLLLLTCVDREISNPVDPRYVLSPPSLSSAYVDLDGMTKLSWKNSDGEPEFFNLHRKIDDTGYQFIDLVDGSVNSFTESRPDSADTCLYSLDAYWYGRSSQRSQPLAVLWNPSATRYYNYTDISIGEQVLGFSENDLLVSARITDVGYPGYKRSLVTMLDRFGNQRWRLDFSSSRTPQLGQLGPDSLVVGTGDAVLILDRSGMQLFKKSFNGKVIRAMAARGTHVNSIVEVDQTGSRHQKNYLFSIDIISGSAKERRVWEGQDVTKVLIANYPSGDILTATWSDEGGLLQRMDSDGTEIWTRDLPFYGIQQLLIQSDSSALLLLNLNSADESLYEFDESGIIKGSLNFTAGANVAHILPVEDGFLILYETSNQYIQKLDQSGNLLWDKLLDSDSHQTETQIAKLSQNQFAIIGNERNTYYGYIESIMFVSFLNENGVLE